MLWGRKKDFPEKDQGIFHHTGLCSPSRGKTEMSSFLPLARFIGMQTSKSAGVCWP